MKKVIKPTRILKNARILKTPVYHTENHNEIIGICIILLSAFIFLFLFTNSAGVMGKVFKKITCISLGFSSYFFPFLILSVGVSFFISKEPKSLVLKIYSIFFLLSNCAVISTLTYYDNMKNRVTNFIQNSIWQYDITNSGQGGGILGEGFALLMVKLLGKSGTWVVSLSICAVSILAISEVSIRELISSFAYFIKNSLSKTKTPKLERFKKPKINERDEDDAPFKLSDEMFEDFEVDIEDEKPKKLLGAEEKIFTYESNFLENTYELPDISLLKQPKKQNMRTSRKILEEKGAALLRTLASFGVKAEIVKVAKGPTVTRFELIPGVGVKVSKITSLVDDIALSLAARSVRIEAPIPGKSAIGIEIPNSIIAPVPVRDVIVTSEFQNAKSKVSFAVGKDISGKPVIADISDFPHVLISGATGAGKSVCINALIASILYKASPDEVKFIMIDPKVVELSVYNDIPHLLVPVVTHPKAAAAALNWCVKEMQRRYEKFSKNSVRNMSGYNALKNEELMPEIIVIIDELADLMIVAKEEVEHAINRLAALARAAGIYLVLATQRPSVNVITGVIKANIPSRIAFAVTSQVDSRTIIDSAGAEKLLGRGDMLYYPNGASKAVRVQGNFVSDEEIEKLVSHVKAQRSPIYEREILDVVWVDEE